MKEVPRFSGIAYTRKLISERKCPNANVPALLRRQRVALTPDSMVDLTVWQQKALCMAGWIDAAHLSFSLRRRLVRQFGPVVQTLVLTMLATEHAVHAGRAAAF